MIAKRVACDGNKVISGDIKQLQGLCDRNVSSFNCHFHAHLGELDGDENGNTK